MVIGDLAQSRNRQITLLRDKPGALLSIESLMPPPVDRTYSAIDQNARTSHCPNDKTEKDSTNLGTFDGGWTELNGGFWYKNRQRVGQRPSVTVTDSAFSGSWAVYGKPYDIQAVDTQGDAVRRLERADSACLPATGDDHCLP